MLVFIYLLCRAFLSDIMVIENCYHIKQLGHAGHISKHYRL